MKFVPFTNESKATIEGPDCWAKVWIFNGNNCPKKMKRQRGS